jgi:hypothetical protein
MKPKNFLKLLLAVLTVIVSFDAARGGLIYSNTTNDLGGRLMLTNGQVIGEELYPDNLNTYPFLTNFSFEFYSPTLYGTASGWNGTVQGRVQFYKNDGTPFNGYGTPNTLFYDTGYFDLLNPRNTYGSTANIMTLTFNWPDLYQPYNFDGNGGGAIVPMIPTVPLPTDFTMVFTFDGINQTTNVSGTDNQVGLPIFRPPAVGTNYGDYWLNNGGSWELVTNTVGPVAFGVQLTADAPEPSVLSLGTLGVLLLGGLLNRRK